MKILTEETKIQKYNNYLTEHIGNVKKAFDWFYTNLPEVLDGINLDFLLNNINAHDKSKYDQIEYDAYADYFYSNNKSDKIKINFNYAWNHHQKCNPHHWQYWVLINDSDEPKESALDMPIEYVIEMICDWWSFSFKANNLNEIFTWYEKNSKNMILSEKTEKLILKIFDKMKKVLNK